MISADTRKNSFLEELELYEVQTTECSNSMTTAYRSAYSVGFMPRDTRFCQGLAPAALHVVSKGGCSCCCNTPQLEEGFLHASSKTWTTGRQGREHGPVFPYLTVRQFLPLMEQYSGIAHIVYGKPFGALK